MNKAEVVNFISNQVTAFRDRLTPGWQSACFINETVQGAPRGLPEDIGRRNIITDNGLPISGSIKEIINRPLLESFQLEFRVTDPKGMSGERETFIGTFYSDGTVYDAKHQDVQLPSDYAATTVVRTNKGNIRRFNLGMDHIVTD